MRSLAYLLTLAVAASAATPGALAANTTKPATTKPATSSSSSSHDGTITTPAPAKTTAKPTTTTAAPSTASSLITFKAVDGAIYADDEPFYIKGVNWFGFETIERVVQGLFPYATTVEDALDLLVSYDVNALRLPLAMDSVLDDATVSVDQTAGTPALAGKSYLEVLDYVINECRKRNILVVLDNHRIEAAEPDFPDVAEPDKITPALKVLAKRYCSNPSTWNVLGIDIKNEPKGKATWGTGDSKTDWDLQAAEIGNAVLEACPRMLIFVEGVQTNIEGVTLTWGQAGGSLHGAKKYPVKLSNAERLVYSPHLISPGVDFKSPWWVDSSFPSNMAKIWDAAFGSVPKATGQPVVVGAWGAKLEGKDEKWANAVATYLAKNNIGSFYWAFNPQSADIGGLVLDDWKTAVAEKFDLLSSLPTTSVASLLKKYSKCSGTCKGSGHCVNGQCECYAGWSGPQCTICTAGDTEACNHFGTCQADSTCQCDSGVDGAYCGGAACDGISCGSGKNAGCTNGKCMCSFNCVGGDCLQCAATSSELSSSVTTLCDSCPAPVKDGSFAASISKASVVAMFGALASALWTIL